MEAVASHEVGSQAAHPAEPSSKRTLIATITAAGVVYVILMAIAIMFLLRGCPGRGVSPGNGAGRGGDDPYAGRRAVHVGGGDGTGPAVPGPVAPAAADIPVNVQSAVPVRTVAPVLYSGIDTPVSPQQEDVQDRPVVSSVRPTGGAAGPYAQRGDRGAAAGMGATAESEAAVNAGLRWLARVQHDDGHWDEEIGPKEGTRRGRHAVGLTSLALLSFLGAGHTPNGSGKYAESVRLGLDWLMAQQQEGPDNPSGVSRKRDSDSQDGRFRQETFYEQGLAAMALCEAYGMTQDKRYQGCAQRALDCIVASMGPDGGYGYGGPGDDPHVTSCQVMGLKSGKLAKLTVPEPTMDRLRAYYGRRLNADGTSGYGPGRPSGSPSGAQTAVGLFCRLFLDCGQKDPDVQKIAALLNRTGPRVSDVFQTYYGTFAMFQMGGDYWKKWNERFCGPVIARQVQEPSDLKGSWVGSHGRVCSTCLSIMALEVYYRFLPVNK